MRTDVVISWNNCKVSLHGHVKAKLKRKIRKKTMKSHFHHLIQCELFDLFCQRKCLLYKQKLKNIFIQKNEAEVE